MSKSRTTKEKASISIKTTIITALATIIVAVIPFILPVFFKQPSASATVIPPAALEAELSKANISLTQISDKEGQVRQWMIDDPQYQTMAQTILTALAGKRVINPIPLDVITGKYRVALGGKEDSYFPPDKYKDIEKTKTAMFDTWKERHPNFSQMSFDEIVELLK